MTVKDILWLLQQASPDDWVELEVDTFWGRAEAGVTGVVFTKGVVILTAYNGSQPPDICPR